MWHSNLTQTGWRVCIGSRARGERWGEFRPDRHGRVKRIAGSADLKVTLQQAQEACAAARLVMPPRGHGVLYGGRSSLIRGEFCELVAASLNSGECV